MNRGLLAKSIRESLPVTVTVVLGLFGVQWLFASILPDFYQDMPTNLLQMPFFRQMVSAFLGAELGDNIGPATMTALGWTHPVILALLWTHAIVHCTRVPAGEVDRGTVDVLLSLPVTRTSIYLCESAVWLVTGLLALSFGLLGNLLGSHGLEAKLTGTVPQRLWVNANLYALYLAAGGVAWLASSLCDRRGRAVAVSFGVLVSSFLLNFLAAFSPAMKSAAFLSGLEYYRPLFILQGDARPFRDIIVLLSAAAVFWSLGWIIFVRRDIRTV